MSSIVVELQKEALDSNIKVSDLLRKALVVAKKLKLKEFESWISKELNGYEKRGEIPAYRLIRGEIKAWNPYRGYIPVIFDDTSSQEILSKRENGQTISELENTIAKSTGTTMLQMPFPPEVQKGLMAKGGHDFPTTLVFPASYLAKIIDAVRTIILNWALKLEEEGILGEDYSFSAQDQKRALHYQNVNNFYGSVNQSQIQQGGSESVLIAAGGDIDIGKVKDFLGDLKKEIKNLKLKEEKLKELNSDIKTIESQIESPKPKLSIVKEGLASIRSILEQTAGNIVAALLLRLGNIQ